MGMPSLATGLYLPRFFFGSNADQVTLYVALSLSLSLFGLTIIEALPTSLQKLNTSFLYRIVLWLLSIHIVFVIPSLMGATVAASFGYNRVCCDWTTTLLNWSHMPWWIRFTIGFFRIIFKNIFYNGLRFCCCSGRRRISRSRQNSFVVIEGVSSSTTNQVLPVHHDESIIRRSSSSFGEVMNDDNPSSTISSRNSNSRTFLTVLGSAVGVVSVVGILSIIGPLVVQLPLENENTTLSLVVSWICAVGLLISSLLNGFGSVSLPYTYLSGHFLHRVLPVSITNLEAELRIIQENIMKKRMMLREATVEISSSSPSGSSSRSSFTGGTSNNTFSKGATYVMSSLLMQNNNNGANCLSELGDDLKYRRQILQTEIVFLEDLVRETTFDLEELKYSQIVAAASRTSIGKIKSSVGIVFSAILLVRLINSGFIIWRSYGTLLNTEFASHHHRKSQSDIVTTTLLWLAGHTSFSLDQYNAISQMVSLVLTAVLSFTQIRTLLRTVHIVQRRLSRFYKKCYGGPQNDVTKIGTSSAIDHSDQKGSLSFIWQIIAGFLGCYSLACTVVIKMMLPEKFSVAFSMALDETGIFTIHSSLVNMVFFSSSVLSTAILGMLLGIQRQNILRHASTLPRGGSNDKICSLPDV